MSDPVEFKTYALGFSLSTDMAGPAVEMMEQLQRDAEYERNMMSRLLYKDAMKIPLDAEEKAYVEAHAVPEDFCETCGRPFDEETE